MICRVIIVAAVKSESKSMKRNYETIEIQPENPDDFEAVSEVYRRAFTGDGEARFVENLRRSVGFIPGLSLVAKRNGKVVGHISFSAVTIKDSLRGSVPSLSLAPLAVLPRYQNRGIGSELVRKGLRECRKAGHKIVVVVGHPQFYSRFGFAPAKPKALKLPFDAPDEAFMVLELVPGVLRGIGGAVEYPPEFSESM